MRRLAILLAIAASPAMAQTNYGSWEPLQRRFESTGGGGVMIDEYDPIVIDDRCVTPFSATLPDGTIYRNIALFRAVPVQGGILCTQARWAAMDRSGQGTSPFQVFIRDGILRRSP
jgi:hypothetical protein